MQLHGKPVKLEIITVGGKIEQIDSFEYTLMLQNQRGNRSPIEVLGMEKISTCSNEINLKRMSMLFRTQLKSAKRRDSEEIDVLIGMQYAGYNPVRKEANGHLLLVENQYGQVRAGSHPQLMEKTLLLVKHATY